MLKIIDLLMRHSRSLFVCCEAILTFGTASIQAHSWNQCTQKTYNMVLTGNGLLVLHLNVVCYKGSEV